MTLQELLDKACGSYELTIFSDTMNYVCRNEKIVDDVDQPKVDYRKHVPEWDAVKNCRVRCFILGEDLNHDGPEMRVGIDDYKEDR